MVANEFQVGRWVRFDKVRRGQIAKVKGNRLYIDEVYGIAGISAKYAGTWKEVRHYKDCDLICKPRTIYPAE